MTLIVNPPFKTSHSTSILQKLNQMDHLANSLPQPYPLPHFTTKTSPLLQHPTTSSLWLPPSSIPISSRPPALRKPPLKRWQLIMLISVSIWRMMTASIRGGRFRGLVDKIRAAWARKVEVLIRGVLEIVICWSISH